MNWRWSETSYTVCVQHQCVIVVAGTTIEKQLEYDCQLSLFSPQQAFEWQKKTHSTLTNPFLPAKNVLEVGFEPTSDWTQRILSPPPWTNSGILANHFGHNTLYKEKKSIVENTFPFAMKRFRLSIPAIHLESIGNTNSSVLKCRVCPCCFVPILTAFKSET